MRRNDSPKQDMSIVRTALKKELYKIAGDCCMKAYGSERGGEVCFIE